MINIPFAKAIDKLPVQELYQTVEEFVRPMSSRLPDVRLQRIIPLAVQGIVSSESPVITQMAQGIPRTVGSTWAIAKRFYRFLGNDNFTTASLTEGLYQVSRRAVQHEAPEYVVVALDPVNFEKPYTRALEGVSIVRKSTPPDRYGNARLTWGYPAVTATVVNTAVPAVTYAHWFSYTSADFLSENRELKQAIHTTQSLLPEYQRRFVIDSGGDDKKIFAWLADDEFVIRASHLERHVEVYNAHTEQWEREALEDLVAVTLWEAEFGTQFHHAGQTRQATLKVGWYRLRLPDTHQPLWAVIFHEAAIDRTTVLLTNVPITNVQTAQQVYRDWRLRGRIEHGYRFDQEQGLDVEDMRVQSRQAMQRLFVLVLLAAQFVFHLIETWPPAAVTWLRRLGGKLDLMIDRDGPYLVLRGISALWQTVVTLSWAEIEPFPHHLFAPG
jgi:hypothetical protein